MSLQVVIAVEALWALIALERTVIVSGLRWWMRSIVVHVLKARCVTAVEVYHTLRQVTHKHRWPARIAEVREDWAMVRTSWIAAWE
jgi:hypothetical protein